MCEIEMLKNHVEKKSDVESLMGLDIDLTDKVIEQLMENLGMCLDFPIVRVVSTIHKTGKSFYDYKMYVRLLKFYLAEVSTLIQWKSPKPLKYKGFGLLCV